MRESVTLDIRSPVCAALSVEAAVAVHGHQGRVCAATEDAFARVEYSMSRLSSGTRGRALREREKKRNRGHGEGDQSRSRVAKTHGK